MKAILLVFGALYATLAPLCFGINNGTTAIPHSHPWLLSLKYDFIDLHFCGASLVRVSYLEHSSDIAITAAHCIDSFSTEVVFYATASVHVQDKRGDIGEVRVGISNNASHPNYHWLKHGHDIAILKLAQPLKFSETIKPIELPTKDEELSTGAECFVAGWGFTKYAFDENGHVKFLDYARVLQQTQLDVATDLACVSMSGYFNWSIDLCSRVKNQQHTLPGDSGSALVCKRGEENVLYGIVAYGVPGSKVAVTGDVYTKVSAFVEWIHEQIEDMNNSRLYRFQRMLKTFVAHFVYVLGVSDALPIILF